jgi:hypothetical protein
MCTTPRSLTRAVPVTNTGWPSVKDGLLAYVGIIELDPWEGDPPVLVVESRSLQSFFGPLAAEYRHNIITLGGQSSRGYYLANDAARHLKKNTTALVVTDYDKPGGDIDRSAENRLRVLVPDWQGEWRRVAVTDAQFQEFGIRQGLAITKPDHRFRPPKDFQTLEAEGVEQSVLEASVRDVLDRTLPVSLADLRAEEVRQQEQAIRRLRAWPS